MPGGGFGTELLQSQNHSGEAQEAVSAVGQGAVSAVGQSFAKSCNKARALGQPWMAPTMLPPDKVKKWPQVMGGPT